MIRVEDYQGLLPVVGPEAMRIIVSKYTDSASAEARRADVMGMLRTGNPVLGEFIGFTTARLGPGADIFGESAAAFIYEGLLTQAGIDKSRLPVVSAGALERFRLAERTDKVQLARIMYLTNSLLSRELLRDVYYAESLDAREGTCAKMAVRDLSLATYFALAEQERITRGN